MSLPKIHTYPQPCNNNYTTTSAVLIYPGFVPNTCGFCVTSHGKIFIDSLRYSWTMNLVMYLLPEPENKKWIPCLFHLTKTTCCHTNFLGYTCLGLPSFPGLLHLQLLITCSMQKWREKAWWILPSDPPHAHHGTLIPRLSLPPVFDHF